jgi:integrase
MIRVFVKWYGEPMDDFKVKVPKTLLPYTRDSEIKRLFTAIEDEKTHKDCIVRDNLLALIALKTGMRHSELGNLAVRDVHQDFPIMVRNSKGGKDRVILLAPAIAERLQNFVKDMKPDRKGFQTQASLHIK